MGGMHALRSLIRFLFGRRRSSWKVVAVVPGLVALVFVGHVYEDEDTLSGLEPVPVVELTTAAEAEPVLYLEEEDTAESAATLTPADAPRRRRRRWPWLLLLVLVVGIVVAFVVWGLAR